MSVQLQLVGEDGLVEGGGGHVVRQAEQQTLAVHADGPEVVAGKGREVEGVVRVLAIHLVSHQVARLHRHAVIAIDVVLQHVVLVRDVEAHLRGQLVDAPVAVFHRIKIQYGAFDGDNLARTLQSVQGGELYLVVEACQALHVRPSAQVVGVDRVFHAALYGGERRARAVVPDARVGIVSVHLKGQALAGDGVADVFVVEGEGHARFGDQIAGNATAVRLRHKGQSGEFILEVVLAVEHLVLRHQPFQQFFAPRVGQADVRRLRLARTGHEREGMERRLLQRKPGRVIQVFVVGQVDGILQRINGNALPGQRVAPIMAGMAQAQHQRVQPVVVVVVRRKVCGGEFRIVRGAHLAPGPVAVAAYLADAVAPCHHRVHPHGADVHHAGIGKVVAEGAFHQAGPKLRVVLPAARKQTAAYKNRIQRQMFHIDTFMLIRRGKGSLTSKHFLIKSANAPLLSIKPFTDCRARLVDTVCTERAVRLHSQH